MKRDSIVDLYNCITYYLGSFNLFSEKNYLNVLRLRLREEEKKLTPLKRATLFSKLDFEFFGIHKSCTEKFFRFFHLITEFFELNVLLNIKKKNISTISNSNHNL